MFEVVNHLGSLLLGVYITLDKFDPFHRSTIDNLQLLLLCREADFKHFRHEKLLSPLISDLRELETNVKATVFCIAGDNLGLHNSSLIILLRVFNDILLATDIWPLYI